MIPHRLIHTSLQLSLGDFVLLDDVNRGSPSRDCIPIERVQHRLRDGLEEIIRFEVLAPQRLAHTVQLLLARSDDHKVSGHIRTSDEIHVADERLKGLRI